MDRTLIKKTEADNQKSMNMKGGDLLLVVLPSNATAGYSWDVVVSPGFPVKLVDQAFMPPPSGEPGAPGHQEFLFVAKAASFAQGGWLRLLYLQSSEQEINIDTKSRELWQINVTVEATK